jgi:2'-5' RNA ligase
VTAARLFTLAYPRLAKADRARLEAFRRLHDPNATVAEAHFTLVFGCDVDEAAYLEHVGDTCGSVPTIDFRCRYAMLGADDEHERAYVFLVPDEGLSEIARLHDALYRGLLSERLRLDLPYIPHLTIGSSPDRAMAKRWCDELNREGLDVRGTLNALTVAAREPNTMRALASFALTVTASL